MITQTNKRASKEEEWWKMHTSLIPPVSNKRMNKYVIFFHISPGSLTIVFFYLRSDSMIICLYDLVRMRQYQSLSPHSSLITHSHCDQQFHTKFSLLLSLSNFFLLFDLWQRAILLNNPKTGKNVSVRCCPRRMPYLDSAMQLYWSAWTQVSEH